MGISDFVSILAACISILALVKSLLNDRELKKSRKIQDELNEIELEKQKKLKRRYIKEY